MTPLRFTLLTRQHGIYRKSVGLAAAHDLAKLTKKPAPMIRRVWDDRAKKPCELVHMGVLINAGMAVLKGDHYHATPQGVEWLEKLTALQILTIPETTSLQLRDENETHKSICC